MIIYLSNIFFIVKEKVEGVNAHPEAFLLHSPLKWVDEDEISNLRENNQTYNLTSNNVVNCFSSKDELNENFNLKKPNSAMVNEIVDTPEFIGNSSASENRESFRSEC